ncbi:MSMEG_0565 family glycosyltransferase [Leptolyngbya sp. BC1307]|uniref:MSMEG_0565 family glycosyltransferase n=1 Tax=Leptolyngbya sp. BC1307 TaxID=2029589 RepID=UPI001F0B3C53|nr:MSMEG_0565 family glycosyltransferase [Leptolyngbya sp. BC1307]
MATTALHNAPNMSLRIALLTYSTKPRGSVIHTLELADALCKLGHQPCVFALDKDGQGFHRQVDFQTCAVPADPYEGDIDGLIKQRIGEFVLFFEGLLQRFDVYHAQDCLSANALALLREKGDIPHFLRTVHHIESFRSPYLQDCQEKSIYQPDRCLCVSDLWQQVLKTEYGIAAHRVINGVSDRFSTEPDGLENLVAETYGINRQPVYLTVGGIEPRKNSIRLLQAFEQVRATQPLAQLVIAGGATLFDYQDYRDAFMAIAQVDDLKEALVLPGVVPDEMLPALYRLADAFVFPSVKEGWGLVVLEAIASGLPVLTANRAPFTEFLSSEEACLVEPENVEAIAAGMLSITQPRPRPISPETITQRYSWQTSAQMHLDLYRQLQSI